MIKNMKKLIFLGLVMVSIATTFYAQDAAWYESDAWYENELGAKKGEANPIHLAITLAECFGHNPTVLDKAIKFWLKRGGNINQTFKLGDFISAWQGKEVLATLPAWYTTRTVTVIAACCGSAYITQALLKNQAKVIVSHVNALDIWVQQYQDFLVDFQESKEEYTHQIDAEFQSQYVSLKLLFAACSEKQQAEFLEKHPECENFMQLV